MGMSMNLSGTGRVSDLVLHSPFSALHSINKYVTPVSTTDSRFLSAFGDVKYNG